MKTLLMLVLLLSGLRVVAQVDTLHSKAAIETYLQHRYHYKSVQLQAVNTVLTDTAAVKPVQPAYWLKGDFNHDGQGDLFVAAAVEEGKDRTHDVFLLLASDHKRYTKVDIGSPAYYWINGGSVSWTSYSKSGRDYLTMACLTGTIPRPEHGGWANRYVYSTTHDTLFVQNGKPMLYTNHLAMQVIESIKFSTTECFGTCPVFQLTIGKDGSVSYKGIEFVDKVGDYTLILTKPDLAYLTSLLAALNLPLLKDNYAVRHTDDQTAYLTVRYANGQTKKISDYGLQGTYGLATLYDFLLGLRNF